MGFTISELGLALLRLGSTLTGLGSAYLNPGSEKQLKQAKLQFIRKSENRPLNKNTFKSGHLAKTLGCFGACKWGGTSGQQNHGAQQQNYEAQPYRVKNELGFTLLKPGSTLSGLGSAVLKPGFEETLF